MAMPIGGGGITSFPSSSAHLFLALVLYGVPCCGHIIMPILVHLLSTVTETLKCVASRFRLFLSLLAWKFLPQERLCPRNTWLERTEWIRVRLSLSGWQTLIRWGQQQPTSHWIWDHHYGPATWTENHCGSLILAQLGYPHITDAKMAKWALQVVRADWKINASEWYFSLRNNTQGSV